MQKIKIKYLITVCAGGLIGLLSFMRVAHAETHITQSYISDNEYWSASSSPYIIDTPINIDAGQTLTIGPGVSIVVGEPAQGYDIFTVQGNLFLNGRPEKRINISGTGSIYVTWATSTISYTDISLAYGVSFNRSYALISSSTIFKSSEGISSESSRIYIKDSSITDNSYGIYVRSSASGGIFQAKEKDSRYGIGGIGNALTNNILALDTPIPSEISITNSAILRNTYASIKNLDTKSVNAINNWWGNDTGPSTTGENSIIGLIEYSPWLLEDPFSIHKPNCCSSILFIPGIEGSRLYKDESWPIVGMTTNTLWEPNRNADVDKLSLNINGSSTDPSVYSGLPIDKAFGFVDIYGQFMKYLDDLTNDGKINEWKAFGYDWRKPITEVVAGAEKKATTTESLLETVTNLAKNSKTGKVTLVAHSNGGLIAKYLVKTLVDLSKESLIDSVISVAVPYLGTPQAIASLLHGDGQSMLGGIILNDKTARNMGVNMASAYSLLPSKEYFSKIFGPTIAFAATTTAGINDGSYPMKLDTFEKQSAFIADENDIRISPAPTSTETFRPIKGNKTLMLASDIIHGILDPFYWPTSISRWAIMGWGLKTTDGLVYSEKSFCKPGTISLECEKAPTFASSKTIMGDGTVVTPSVAYNSGIAVAIDLPKIAINEDNNISHANILEASSTRTAIDAIITHNPADGNQEVIQKISMIPGVSIGEPDYSKGKTSYLKLSTHSPVELHVYDSKGNHTGLISKPAAITEDIEDGLFTYFEEKVIGSSFESSGGSTDDPEYQVYLPDNNGEKYSVVMNGTGLGEFTFDVDRIKDGVSIDQVEYAYMPVTPLTIATTTVIAQTASSMIVPLLASTTSILNIDIDGNGTADIMATPKMSFDPLIYLESAKTTIITLTQNSQIGKNLIKRIDKIEDLIKKGKAKQINKSVSRLDKKVNHLKLKKLSEKDKKQILDLIDTFIKEYE